VQLLLAAGVVGAALIVAAWIVASRRQAPAVSPQDGSARRLEILRAFAPGIAAAADDPRALLVWQPLAATARNLFPDDFAAIDRAAGATFPFSSDFVQAAHARWSTDWLAWERTHDAEYKLKAASAEEELRTGAATPALRARLESLEREKLERYQRRYEEYIRVSKALKHLIPS
jgi:hypothetical protein